MYNRYIPRQDGSYTRRSVPEPQKPSPTPPPPTQEEPCCDPAEERYRPQPEPVTGFLRRLIPKDFDTGDLIVILLLLLMAGDCQEDRNNAILTIALYFLM